MNMSSPVALWSLINQLQLLMLLILTKRFIHEDPQNIIINNDIFMFDMKAFLPLENNKNVKDGLDWIDKEQNNENLSKIGVESGSTAVNISGLVTAFTVLFLVHIFVFLLNCLTPNKPIKCLTRVMKYITSRLFDLFTFTIYIRILLEAYQHLMLSSLSEVLLEDYTDDKKLASFFVSLSTLAFVILFLGFILIYYLINKEKFETHHDLKGKELFVETKDKPFARIYSFTALLRRFALIAWLVSFNYLDPLILVLGMAGVQSFYTLFMIILKPYKRLVNNMIEIIHELFFTILVFLLIYLDKEEKWTNTVTTVFSSIILANSAVVLLISMGSSFVSVIKLLKRKFSKGSTSVNPKKRMRGQEESKFAPPPQHSNATFARGSTINQKSEVRLYRNDSPNVA